MSDSSGDVARASAWMALGTIVSRLTGFLRALLLIWAIGTSLDADLFDSANSVPNSLYILVAGGVFNVVLVPQLVRAMRRDDDGGDAYANRIITLGLLVLLAATVLLVVAVPLLLRVVFDSLLFTAEFSEQRESARLLMYLCVPQVFFYGAFVLVGQVLNARRRFGPMMWAPIVNNVVACLALGSYVVVFGREGGSDGFTLGEALLLGIGSTLGIVVQSAVLIPYLRATGFHYRPRFDFRGVGLGHTVRLGGWTLAFIAVNQVAFVVVNRLGTGGNLAAAKREVEGSGSAVYGLGFLISQVPHGVITVSLATAVMPTLASFAQDRQLPRMGLELGRTLRMALVVIAPVAVALACLGHELASAISLGAASDDARIIGDTIVGFTPAMVLFCVHFLMLRGFYADEDTRTPFLLQVLVTGVNVTAAIVLTNLVAPVYVSSMLAVSFSLAYLVGSIASVWVLSRRCGRIVDAEMLRFAVRATVACAIAAAAMLGSIELLALAGIEGDRPVGALLTLAVAGAAGGLAYLLAARLVRITEIQHLVTSVLRRR